MCTNLHTIHNPYTHDDFLVKCGHCAACLQEKAIKRTLRIKNNTGSPNETCLFVTLTYDNRYVPYIRPEDLAKLDAGTLPFDIETDSYVLPIHRDGEVRWIYNRHDKKHPLRRVREHYPHFIDYVFVPSRYHDLENQTFLFAKNSVNQKITVCYFKDVQKFLKRLRIHFKRKYPNEKCNIIRSVFVVNEYGAKSARAHFHLLLWIDSRFVCEAKSAIATCWSYDSFFVSSRNVEVAKNAASYVSSYVNSHSSVPYLFRKVRSLNQKHSYSKHFGFNNPDFTYDSVLEKVRNGDLHYDIQQIKNGVQTISTYLLPKYVINRYFPKFKGFSNFFNHEIVELGLHPERIYRFNRKKGLGLTPEQEISIFSFFIRKKRSLPNYIDWLHLYSRVWSVYASNLKRDACTQIRSVPLNFYAYDNIIDYYRGVVTSPSLDDCMFKLPFNFVYLTDPNTFPQNVLSTLKYSILFASYDKSRKYRAAIFNECKPNFGI